MVYIVCHSQQSDHGRHYLLFSVWSASTLFAILSSLIRVCIICHSFSVVLSRSTLCAILSIVIRVYTTCSLIKVKVYTVILRNNLIRVYTICHSQQSGQGLHYLPFSAVWSRSRSTLSFSRTDWSGCTLFVILCSLISVYCFPFSIIWSGSILFSIRSLIKVYTVCHSQQSDVYTICHSQQSDQGLHCLPFSATWSGSTLFAILSLIRVYTICHSL